MTAAHPPREHNPHVWQDVLITRRDIPPAIDESPTGSAQPDANPVAAEHATATTAPSDTNDVDPGQVTDNPTIPPATEGGEQPSAAQETEDPAGTDSSGSSSPDVTSTESSENATPSPAPSAENPSTQAGKKAKFTAGGGTGTGTGR